MRPRIVWRTRKKFNEQANEKGIDKKEYKRIVHDKRYDEQKRMMKPIYSKVPGGYQMDLLAQTKNANPPYWFIFINVNTRKAYAYPCGGKNIETIKHVLDKFISDAGDVTQITSDREPAFLSKQIISELIDKNIDLQVTEENDHNKLGIINRFMRTLRDMNEDERDISESEMNELISEYNNSTHSTTHKKPIKFTDESEYIHKQSDITDRIESLYPLNKDDEVRIIMPKNKFNKRRRNLSKTHVKVIDRDKNQFIVQAKDNSIETYPRYMLMKLNDNSTQAESLNDDKKGLVTKIIGHTKRNGITKYKVLYDGGSDDWITEKELNRNNPTKMNPMITEYLNSK
jgi:hypothetical protein